MKKFIEFFKHNTTKIAVALLIIMSVILLSLPDDNPSRNQGADRAAARKGKGERQAAPRPENCFFVLDKVRGFIQESDKERFNANRNNSPLADISRTWGRFYRGTLEKTHGPAPLIRKRGKCFPNTALSDFDRWFEGTYKPRLWPRYVERFDKALKEGAR
ncbi:MAG: hypothetical protein FWD15_03880 [Alphaproteobacteria bacterium]|nr:hypothetical protein [Alphaproteobacteria bacterium]